MVTWGFRNDERSFATNRFRPKSSFNPRNKDVIIETYLSCLEERLLDIETPPKRFNNLTKEELEALYSLKDDSRIIIKGAYKGSVFVVWDREHYLKEANRQLDDKEVFELVPDNPSVFADTLIKALEKIGLRWDLANDFLNYFLVKDTKYASFYLLPTIHKGLHDVPGRPGISILLHWKKILIFELHLQPQGQKGKSYIKDTNHFLSKLHSLERLPQGVILCTIDVLVFILTFHVVKV